MFASSVTCSAVAAAAFVVLPLAKCAASYPVLQFEGLGWDTGGYPPSEVLDEFVAVGSITAAADFPWDPAQYSYTFYLRELVSFGEAVFGSTRVASYVGGRLTIYRDAAPGNQEYGASPPNLTSPSTFADGEIYLDAEVEEFTWAYDPVAGAGGVSASVSLFGGTGFPEISCLTGFAWGASMSPGSAGYDLAFSNGCFYCRPTDGDWPPCDPVATQPSTWGSIKATYR